MHRNVSDIIKASMSRNETITVALNDADLATLRATPGVSEYRYSQGGKLGKILVVNTENNWSVMVILSYTQAERIQ